MTRYRFTSRRPMSYRAVLRSIPKGLRCQWWSMRWQYAEPRVDISRFHGARVS